MSTLSAHVRFRRHPFHGQGGPPHSAVKLLVAELDASLRRAGLAPTALRCECWSRGIFEGGDGHDQLARITIETEPGTMTRSLASWFQWQHPQWEWDPPVPAIEGARGLLLENRP